MAAFGDFHALKFAQMFQEAPLWFGFDWTEEQAAALRLNKSKSAARSKPVSFPSLLWHQNMAFLRHLNNCHWK
jgi:hypothetical protein